MLRRGLSLVTILCLGLAAGALLDRVDLGAILAEEGGRGAARPERAALAEPPEVTKLQNAYRAAAALIKPSVVHIYTERTVRGRGFSIFEPDGKQRGLGSGVIVDGEGHALTNNHVVDGADTLMVHLSDGRTLEAKVVGTDPLTDIAVIRLEGEGFEAAPLGDSDTLDVGDFVLAAGNPFGLEQTITAGIVSAKGRTNVGVAEYEDFIQTDAAINPGNSGGPLVNIRGEVVGINTAISSATGGYQGVGFAVPINMAKLVLAGLLGEEGRVVRGYLGVSIQGLTPELAKSLGLERTEGALVAEVLSGSPADRAGIERGDVIVRFADRPVRDANSFRNAVAATPPGTKAPIVLARSGESRAVEVEIGELPGRGGVAGRSRRAPRPSPSVPEPGGGGGREGSEKARIELGLELRELTPELARRYGYDEGEEGLLVVEVERGGLAFEVGVRVGSLLREIDGRAVRDFASMDEAVKGLDAKRGIRLLLTEGGVSRYVFIRRG